MSQLSFKPGRKFIEIAIYRATWRIFFSVIASYFYLKKIYSSFYVKEPTLNKFLIFSPKKLFLCYMKCNFIALSLKTSCVSGGNFPSTKDKRKIKKNPLSRSFWYFLLKNFFLYFRKIELLNSWKWDFLVPRLKDFNRELYGVEKQKNVTLEKFIRFQEIQLSSPTLKRLLYFF